MKQQEQPLKTGNLGFFSSPVLMQEGSYAGKVLKRYKHGSLQKCRYVAELHDRYVAQLREVGILLPETRIEVIESGRQAGLQIVQDPFEQDELVRELMQTADQATCVKLMNGVIADAVRMINFCRENPDVPLGFHPTLRNYATRNGQFYFLDTFPPMGGISETEVRKLMLDFAPYKLPGLLKPLMRPFMGYVTREYYDPVKMVMGIVGSTCRLHPEGVQDFLKAAKEPIQDLHDQTLKARIEKALQQPPRLGKLWVGVRRLLGLQGKPNV